MARYLATAVVLLSGLACGCLGNDGPDPGEQIYESSLELWNTEGPASYDMVLRRQTISANPDLRVVITVRNEVVTSRIYFGTDIPVTGDAAASFPDIPGLFALLREAMDGDPYLVSALYDETYGYPRELTLDETAASTNDNVTFTVEEFTPVE
jgi:Family of unknown function (DUF6174)